MRTSAVVATLIAAASAAPVAQQGAASDYKFEVTEWNAGCARSGCSANFKVSAAATGDYPQHPPFEATCFVEGEGADYQACTLTGTSSVSRSVKAKLLEATRVDGENTIAHVQITYQHADVDQAGTYWNATGSGDARYNAAVMGPMDFTIAPQWFGVA